MRYELVRGDPDIPRPGRRASRQTDGVLYAGVESPERHARFWDSAVAGLGAPKPDQKFTATSRDGDSARAPRAEENCYALLCAFVWKFAKCAASADASAELGESAWQLAEQDAGGGALLRFQSRLTRPRPRSSLFGGGHPTSIADGARGISPPAQRRYVPNHLAVAPRRVFQAAVTWAELSDFLCSGHGYLDQVPVIRGSPVAPAPGSQWRRRPPCASR